MDNAVLVIDRDAATTAGLRRRAVSVVLALALVFAAVVLLQARADASPAGSAGTALVAAAAAPTAIAAQIDVGALIRSIVCPILNALAAAFRGAFFAFVGPIINSLQVAFGCTGVSGT